MAIRFKVTRRYPLNEGSLAGCEPPVLTLNPQALQGRTTDLVAGARLT